MFEFTYRCPRNCAWAILKISDASGNIIVERTLMRGYAFTAFISECAEITTILPVKNTEESDFYIAGS